MEVGLDPGDVVLDGAQLSPTERATASSHFSAHVIVAKRSPISATDDLLFYYVTAECLNIQNTTYSYTAFRHLRSQSPLVDTGSLEVDSCGLFVSVPATGNRRYYDNICICINNDAITSQGNTSIKKPEDTYRQKSKRVMKKQGFNITIFHS